jgi:hypothetical protein
MKKINIERGSKDLNSTGGLSLISAQLSHHSFPSTYFTTRKDTTNTADYLYSYLGLLSLGKTEFDSIEKYRNNRLFKHCLGLDKVPSSSALRQNFNSFSLQKSTFEAVHNLNQQVLSPVDISPLQCAIGDCVPLDIDVTPLDNSGSKKEGVSCTYKLFDGYAPIIAYLGVEGYAVHGELREGKQHCQNGMGTFLEDTLTYSFQLLPENSNILLRLDGGHDSAENQEIIAYTDRCYAIIKRNLRKESSHEWLDRAERLGDLISDDGMVRHYRGFVTDFVSQYDGKEYTGDVVFDITYTYADSSGQLLMFPEIDVDTYWTNLPESPEKIIQLYHDHATSEQFHSEIKTDMDVERLPSGKFATNRLVFQLALTAYNMLRRISVEIIPYNKKNVKKVKRRRIRTVLLDIIYTGCQWIESAGRRIMRFGCNCIEYEGIDSLYQQFSI